MGPIQQQLAAVTSSSESFTLIVLILGALFTLIGGSYIFSWKVLSDAKKGRADLWEAVKELKTNDIKHLEERITKVEKRF